MGIEDFTTKLQKATIESLGNNLDKLDALATAEFLEKGGHDFETDITVRKSGLDSRIEKGKEDLENRKKDLEDPLIEFEEQQLKGLIVKREYIIDNSLLERVQAVREDFLSNLDKKELKYFSNDINSYDMGVNGNMYVIDKNILIYYVNGGSLADKDSNLYNIEGPLYKEKITLTEQQRQNFLDFLDWTIPELRSKAEFNSSSDMGLTGTLVKEYKNVYEENLRAREILKNGKVEK